jgi:hypothetical protein
MPPSTYGKYVSREIIEESKYPKITAPMVNYRGDRGGRDLTFQWSCITQPLEMDQEPEVSDRDQFLLFASTNLDDVRDFDAEVAVPLGPQRQRQPIHEPTFVYIPAGMVHGPIEFKRVGSPIALWRYSLDAKYSEHWVSPDYSNHVVRPGMTALGGSSVTTEEALAQERAQSEPDIKVTEMGGRPFRHMRIPMGSGVSCWCKPLGIQANLCTGLFVTRFRDYCSVEPIHYHQRFDEWMIFLGGNPLNVEEFDAEIEMFWGREQEKQVIDCTCVAHIPPGLVHIGQDHRRVGKPYWECVTVAGTGDYFAECEKVVLSREEWGEPMISEGAADWVPVSTV